MTPRPVEAVSEYVEQIQASIADPEERDRALQVVERELTDVLGRVTTYRNDSGLEQEASAGSGTGEQPGEQAKSDTP